MNERIGTCSLCGGDVVGFRGIWMSITPPPPDRCTRCGAVVKGQGDVIEMVPSSPATERWRDPYTGTTTTYYGGLTTWLSGGSA